MCVGVGNTANLISTPHWLVNIATTAGTIVTRSAPLFLSLSLVGPNGRVNRIQHLREPVKRHAKASKAKACRHMERPFGDNFYFTKRWLGYCQAVLNMPLLASGRTLRSTVFFTKAPVVWHGSVLSDNVTS